METTTQLSKDYKPTSSWSETDWDKFVVWLKGVLLETTVTVTFTKKDGSERVMNCTLNPSVLPTKQVTSEGKTRKQPTNTISVYDINQNDWRSFTIKSVKRVEFTL